MTPEREHAFYADPDDQALGRRFRPGALSTPVLVRLPEAVLAAVRGGTAALGHTRIGYVAGSMTSMSAHDRLAGYREAVEQRALAAERALVIHGESDQETTERAVLEHFTGASQRATALVVSNNQMTLGALRALKRCGLSVPRDIALVCYDDFEWADLFEPQISAMRQDGAVLAATAVELLLARVADPSRPPQTVVVPTEFRHRNSCGCE